MKPSKAALRQRLERVRSALPEAERSRLSHQACQRLLGLTCVADARTVALYWPMLARGELDVREVDRMLRGPGKVLYYPFIDRTEQGLKFGFRRVEDTRCLEQRGRGFSEPDPAAPEAQQGELDLLVVPALGVSPCGVRLGHGMGFYDTVLPRYRPPAQAIAVAFEVQVVEELPTGEHDQSCDLVVTDARLLESRSYSAPQEKR